MSLPSYICIFSCLICGVSADSWDDFTNNLATDLAPFITLFGEQITLQCLSELVSPLDDFIFALAPLGILTAVVSAIRVCGNSTLRALIGRAQEDPGASELEILSCVSDTTAEIFTESGVARITGNPKILEVVVGETQQGASPVSVQRLSEIADKTWTTLESSAKLPNLSLNKGVRRRAQFWFYLAAVFGVALQLGIILYSALTVMYWPTKFLKNGNLVSSYAFPMFVTGTTLLTLGMFFCALLVERCSSKHILNLPRNNRVYWIQPGNQMVGDQKLPAFVGCTNPGVDFIRSVRNHPSNSNPDISQEVALIIVISITMLGFVIQFVGLRGLHASIPLAQLGATLVMTVVRIALRAGRMNEKDNLLEEVQEDIANDGHELDWLTMRLFNISSFKVCGFPGHPTEHRAPTPLYPVIQDLISIRMTLREFAGAHWIDTPVQALAHNLSLAAHKLSGVISQWSQSDVSNVEIVIPFEIEVKGSRTLRHNWKTHFSAITNGRTGPLEAILGLYVWSLKSANTNLTTLSQNEYFRSFRPNRITPHQARLLCKTWTKNSTTIDRSQMGPIYLLNESHTIGHTRYKTDKYLSDNIPAITVSSDLYTLAAQDIYLQLLYSMLEPLKSLGGSTTMIGTDKNSYRAHNNHVEALASIFSEAKLGSYSEGMLCTLRVLSDRSLIGGVLPGLGEIRQNMESFTSNFQHSQPSLITMSEWLCSVADYNEVKSVITEYAHICLKILLEPDIVAMDLAAERIAAILDVKCNDPTSSPVSEHLDLESVPSECWRAKFQVEVSWMVTHLIGYVMSVSPGRETMTTLQKLKTRISSVAPGSRIPHSPSNTGLTTQSFFEIWARQDYCQSIENDEPSQLVLNWLIDEKLEILQELLVISLVNDTANKSRLLAVVVYAAQQGYLNIVRLLRYHSDQNDRKEDIIIGLAREGYREALKSFLRDDTSARVTKIQEAAFLTTATCKHPSILELLLDRGVDINVADIAGTTALIAAAKNGDIESIRVLLSHKANIEQKDAGGDTALIYATTKGHLPVVKLLVDSGANVNAIGFLGRTPLMAAIVTRNLSLVKYLCSSKADPNITDAEQYSVLDMTVLIDFGGPWKEGHAFLSANGAQYSRGPHSEIEFP